jgi:large subunit ribosomal protein L2
MSEILKKLKPYTPSNRSTILLARTDLSTKKDLKLIKSKRKKLLTSQKNNAGRNSFGRITTRHQGGGHKKASRIIAFKRTIFDVPGKVISIEYDPNRNVPLALIEYENGVCQFMVSYDEIKIGDVVSSGAEVDIKSGNSLPIGRIPVGTEIYSVELRPGSSASLVRSAGTSAKILGRAENRVLISLPSGRTVSLLNTCYATVGKVANALFSNIVIGKAGRNRWKGKRPSVRGVAMNPVDHPHGGGEGKTSGGRHPCTPWGMPTKGYKTVRRKKK